jgi:dihydroflavonol-4-reductase
MILVTGGTGFLGSHLLARLADEHVSVRALKRPDSSFDNLKTILAQKGKSDFFQKIEWVECDLMDYSSLLEATKEITHIFHAAASVSFSKKDFNDTIKNNVRGTENLINAALVNSAKRICHVSSIAALGNAENGELIDENTEWKTHKNNSSYSISKYYSELHVWRGFSEGLTGVIVNPSLIMGKGMSFSGAVEMIQKYPYYPCGSNGFVDVTDVVEIMIKLTLYTEITGERYILSAENLSLKQLVEYFVENTGKTIQPKKISKSSLKFFYFLLSAVNFIVNKKTIISKDMIRMITTDYAFSNQKIKTELSYNFKSVEESIKGLINK